MYSRAVNTDSMTTCNNVIIYILSTRIALGVQENVANTTITKLSHNNRYTFVVLLTRNNSSEKEKTLFSFANNKHQTTVDRFSRNLHFARWLLIIFRRIVYGLCVYTPLFR